MARATLYADFDLTTGGETGADATNAWRNLQDAVDGKNGSAPVADTILCKGTDSISAVVDIDQGSGDTTDGDLIFRGVNASWVNDGTRAIIDGGGNAIDLIRFNGPDYVRFENFTFRNTSKASGMDGITGAGYVLSYGISFINCLFDDCHTLVNGATSWLLDPLFFKCQFKNAASIAFFNGNN